MSMSPPPLPPDPYGAYPPVAPPAGNPGVRAAIAVWVSAALMLVLSSCCVGLIAMVGVLPMDQLRQADEAGQVPAETWDQIAQFQQYMPIVAGVLALFTVVPSVVMLVLGFSVKNGGRGATITAMVLSIVALLGIGLMLLFSVIGMVQSGQIDICGMSLFLGLAACFVWCVISLKQALAATSAAPAAFTPMHQHPAPGSAPGITQGQAPGRSPDDDPWENSL